MPAIRDQFSRWPVPPTVDLQLDYARSHLQSPNVPNSDVKTVLSPNARSFADLDDRFLSVLRLLRFEQIFLDVERFADDGTWTSWRQILHAWADQFCFYPLDYHVAALRMRSHIQISRNVGAVLHFVLSDSLDDPLTSVEEWFRDYNGHMLDMSFNPLLHKACMCVMFRVPENTLDWSEFDFDKPRTLSVRTTAEQLIARLVRQCDDVFCPYGLLTDGVRTLMFYLNDPTNCVTRWVSFRITAVTEHSVAYCIASILCRYSRSLLPSWTVCHGAMNAGPSPACVDSPQCFRDFDLYQLQRDRRLFEMFLDWKAGISAQAAQFVPRCGQVLLIHRDVIASERPATLPSSANIHPAAARLLPWRCPVRYRRSVPIDTQQALSGIPRPRDAEIDRFLDSTEALCFVVERTVQSGHNKFSQVVFGRLKSGDQLSARLLCLKLLDERFFDVPTLEEYDGLSRPSQRLRDLNFADDMLRREEAVYSRLSEYQGTLLPHCYGFHEFQICDVEPEQLTRERATPPKVLGFLMEKIEGCLLEDMIDELMSWSAIERRSLLVRMRHVVRLLNASGISQRDWSLRQIMCIRRPVDGPEQNRAESMDVVLIDFAFATQPTGQWALLDEVNDVGELFMVLAGLGLDLMKEIKWLEREDYES